MDVVAIQLAERKQITKSTCLNSNIKMDIMTSTVNYTTNYTLIYIVHKI